MLTMDQLTQDAVAAAAGDPRALDAFVRASADEVRGLCVVLGGRDVAEDLAQEVYERAIRALPSFRAESSARTWLLTIARRTCADHVRRAVRRRRLDERVSAQPTAVVVDASGGAVELDQLVAALPVEFREAFTLTQVLGLGYAEAAEVCGCPIGTIRSRVARAREALAGELRAPERTGRRFPDGDVSAVGKVEAS